MTWSNHFLDALPPQTVLTFKDTLERVRLERDHVLAEVDRPVHQVILPINSIVSVIAVMEDGACIESRTIGRESGFGLMHAIGSRISFERVIVQVGGDAWQIKIDALAQAARANPDLTAAVIRHAQATIVQTAQFMACNTLHTAQRRLCRWLLMTQDRLQSDVVPLTQEHLATMLGVQRTTVTALASALQEKKAIAYSRGRIRIHDRAALRQCACECYDSLTHAVDQILDADR